MKYLNIETDGVDVNGIRRTYKLSEFNGERVIVYFYPQDDTPVCTQQARDFRDAMPELSKLARVIGVSSDSVDSHIEFRYKYNLNFILLSDPDGELKCEFKNHDKYLTEIKRATFILDKEGNIVKYWNKVDADGHVQEIIDYLKNN